MTTLVSAYRSLPYLQSTARWDEAAKQHAKYVDCSLVRVSKSQFNLTDPPKDTLPSPT